MIPTQTKLVALALAVLLTAASGGVAAAVSASHTDVVSSDETETKTDVSVDGYEFVVSDENDAFGHDRTTAIPELIMNDADAAEAVRELFDGDERLAVAVYGSLVDDEDGAHVRITQATDAHPTDPLVVAVTVDLEEGTASVAGVDAERTAADARFEANESVQIEAANESQAGQIYWVTAADDRETLSADEITSLHLDRSAVDVSDGNETWTVRHAGE